jgi:radical SAM superfamily enzyme YgiQ (UPF0313 family)
MADIVLTTLNAKYAHASLGLRYLVANLGELRGRAVLREHTINDRPVDVAELLLRDEPRIIGIGVYIWNARQSLELVRLLKAVRPELVIVLGGPEVSHEIEAQEITAVADYVVCGEGETAFRELCAAVLAGAPPKERVRPGGLPALDEMVLPYALYSAHDLEHRVVYVEASRGCPFSCEFCLSSLDEKVRSFPLERLLAELDTLWARGLRKFKFVDRTFNLSLAASRRILEFFLARAEPQMFLHFEMIPDRLPKELRALVARFAPGSLQLEIGVQTLNPTVGAAVSRRQDVGKLEENFTFLREHTSAHVHADLIVGLPGEDLASFAAGFDRLLALRPQEVQVGILKRLRGTPIVRHDRAHGMVYSAEPPYEVLRTDAVGFVTMQRLKRFARYWDMIANSGNFPETLEHLMRGPSSCMAFLELADWLHARTGRTNAIALEALGAYLVQFLSEERGLEAELARRLVLADYIRPGRKAHALVDRMSQVVAAAPRPAQAPRRQRRHLMARQP